MIIKKKQIVVSTCFVFFVSTLLILLIGSGPVDPRLGLMIIVALQAAILLGMLVVGCLLYCRAKIAAESMGPLKASIDLLDASMQRKCEQLGTSMQSELRSLERSSQARFQKVDQRLGRQGRRVEATYRGIQLYLAPSDPTREVVPFLTQVNTTNELLDRANASLLSLKGEVDQSSKRLREHSGYLRQLLEEQSKVSSDKVLRAQAAVIEELLEGIDAIAAQSHRNES